MKITTVGKQLIASIKNARLKTAIATKHLLAKIEVGEFLLLRQLFDSLGVSEVVSKVFGTSKTDDVSTSETVELGFTKGVSDNTISVDSVAKDVNKTANDVTDASDVIAASLAKNISDAVTSSDSALSAVGLNADNTVYATDDVGAEATIDDDQYMLFGKNVIDAPGVTDAVSLTATFQREFSDTVNISDLVEPVVGRLQTESLSMTEIIELLAGKGVSDTLSTTDSGSLISQDYVDNNQYFDADYVGQFRTF